jgi:DNA-binding NtrC family response regulator
MLDESSSSIDSGSAAAPYVAPNATTLLIVDDEPSNLASLEKIFLREGMRVLTADGAKAALEVARTHRVHVVLTDLMMPGTSGVELLRALKQVSPDTEVVVMTAYGTVETAVQAMRDGAYDFVEKPLKRIGIVKSVRKAAERQSLVEENRTLRQEIKLLTRREIVGTSQALRRVLDVATQAAPSSATVLVLGESGTGKELLARYIHEQSSRARGAFIAVNCSAIPETILEAELFGHERGAFTGAVGRREGRFAKAAGGTLFLDEIGELSPSVQVKLLRVLQEGEYERVGEDVTRKVDVRVIAATNQNLAEEVRARRFREDLFYRLNVVPLALPPLRARREDIPLLAAHAIADVSKRLRIQAPTLTQADAARLQQYDWPGNIRELRNVIERAVILSKGVRLRLDMALADLPATAPSATDMPDVILTDRECRARERTNLMKALQRAEGRIYGAGGAAELLGINPTTLASRLRALKITPLKRH